MEKLSTHKIYKLKDGTRVPSVTTIIGQNLGWGREGLMGWSRKKALAGIDPNTIRDQAGQFGRFVHESIERLDIPGPEPKRPDWFGSEDYLKAARAVQEYREWAAAHNASCREHETSLISEQYRFGGTIDWSGTVGPDDTFAMPMLAIMDVKTSSHVGPEMRIQLAAYRHLYYENRGEYPQVVLLHLGKGDRDYRDYPMPNLDREWAAFQALLGLHQLRKDLDPFEWEDTVRE